MADEPDLAITFVAEEMYFWAAQQAFQQIAKLRAEVLKGGKNYPLAELLLLAKSYDLGDEVDPDVDVSNLDDTTEELHTNLDRFALAAASVDIFAVMTLEAHINAIADRQFSSATFKLFDRLSLEGKWLFFPQLIGLGEVFNTSMEPFQSFHAIIRRRNGTVHTKGDGRTVVLKHEAIADDYMASKLDFAERALHTTCSMASALAKAMAVEAPAWTAGELPRHYVIGDAS